MSKKTPRKRKRKSTAKRGGLAWTDPHSVPGFAYDAFRQAAATSIRADGGNCRQCGYPPLVPYGLCARCAHGTRGKRNKPALFDGITELC